jgi:glycopeptide antibiotics resistance protein
MKTFGSKQSYKYLKSISATIFIIYVSYLIYLTFFDHFYGRGFTHRSINFIPFKTIIKFLSSSYNFDIVVTNIAGNIAAFVPMGFLLPIVFSRLSGVFRVFIVCLSATLSIEFFQYFTVSGVIDIVDILLNVIGGLLGYLINMGITMLMKKVKLLFKY